MIISKFTSRTNQNEPPKVIGGGPWGGLTPCPEGGGAMGSHGCRPGGNGSRPVYLHAFVGLHLWGLAHGPRPMAHGPCRARGRNPC